MNWALWSNFQLGVTDVYDHHGMYITIYDQASHPRPSRNIHGSAFYLFVFTLISGFTQ